MKLTLVAGARPNFMKIAPIIHAFQKAQGPGIAIKYRLVHTGQHYDTKMSGAFFEELKIPEPDVNLSAGSGTQAEQTAAIMVAFERELEEHPADLVIVVGDVNSTLACSIVAKKMNTKVAHVEAGIRSFDLSMPEEINRMVTDSIADYFFTTSEYANQNLRKTGVSEDRIFFVGNVMIDTLLAQKPFFRKPAFWDGFDLKDNGYFVVTLHRPVNVDSFPLLKSILDEIVKGARGLPIIFPVHPRTAKTLKSSSLGLKNLHLVDPLGYLEFNFLTQGAKAVITDSGGITEETTVMGVPCMTLRDTTERPETCSVGTNELLGSNPANLAAAFEKLFKGEWKKGTTPDLWDGAAAKRIVAHLIEFLK